MHVKLFMKGERVFLLLLLWFDRAKGEGMSSDFSVFVNIEENLYCQVTINYPRTNTYISLVSYFHHIGSFMLGLV